jgi:hypothetical protein
MTMDQALAVIGQPVDSEAVQALVMSAPLVESADLDLEEGEPLRHSLMNHREGYELTHVQGRITAAHLFLVATEGYAPFRGALVADLSPGSTRDEVRRRLGRPSLSGVQSRRCQRLCGLSLRCSLLSPHVERLLRSQVRLIHLVPDPAQVDHPQVDDPLTALPLPGHPRLLHPLGEHRLARRLRHPAADRQVIPAVAAMAKFGEITEEPGRSGTRPSRQSEPQTS